MPVPLGGGLARGMGEKESVKVSYLTSSQYNGLVMHYFQTVESVAQRIDNVHRQRRTFAIVDPHDYSSDIHLGVTRCVMVSKIEEITLPTSEMKVLLGPFTEFDVLCQGSSMLDFIRTIGALYSPNAPGNKMILLQLQEGQQQQKSVRCTLYTGDIQAVVPRNAPSVHRAPSQPAPPPPPALSYEQRQRSATPDIRREVDVNQELRNRIAELEGEVQNKMKESELSERVLKNEINGLKHEMGLLSRGRGVAGVTLQAPQSMVSAAPVGFGSGSNQGSGSSAMWNDTNEPRPPPGPPPMWLSPVTNSTHQMPSKAETYKERSIYNSSSMAPTPLATQHASQQPSLFNSGPTPMTAGHLYSTSSVPRNPPPRSVTRPPPQPATPPNQSSSIWGF
eukprot:TRINITY_DN34170_c0_g1_i1.p1 TRINITY_DN34170_c0_g1~~TRINITY_DN34170_c0_g1_i1.p1  ORF type:complete len:407 (+),score=93.29 TRINITY_DN34170_c0_g1_i1:47-1222(+)